MKLNNPFYSLLIFLFAWGFLPDAIATTSLNPGRNDLTLNSEGVRRNYVLHIPQNYTGKKTVPLVFMFHGTGGDGEKFWRMSGWKELAEREGFIAVFPSALTYCIEENGVTRNISKWNSANIPPIICQGDPVYDDVKFVREIIGVLTNKLSIDQSRIYASGFSNGATFVNSRLAVEATDVFAALSAVGGLSDMHFNIKNPVPQYLMLGQLDPIILAQLPVNALPLTESGLRNITDLWDIISTQLENNQLADIAVAEEQTKYVRITFLKTTGDIQTNLVLTVVGGLLHRYPNGNNNPAGLKAANQFYKYFIQYSK